MKCYPIEDGSFYSTVTLTMGTLEDCLCKAVGTGDWPLVQLFLDHSVDLNNYDKTSPFPLETAVLLRSPETYRKLVELGADIHYREERQLNDVLPRQTIFDREMLTFLLEQEVRIEPSLFQFAERGRFSPGINAVLMNYEERL